MFLGSSHLRLSLPWPRLLSWCRCRYRWRPLLLLLLLLAPTDACLPGRHGARRTREINRQPLVKDEYLPAVSEHTLVASGLAEGAITREDPRFKDLVVNSNPDIQFKDEERTGADRIMSKRCKEMLDLLATLVRNEWPGVYLRVTEAWDEDGAHTEDSLHYEGRAVDLTTSDRDRKKYGMLGRLALQAGFDWVYYESWTHIHASVMSDTSEAAKWGGCFPAASSVTLPGGGRSAMSEVRPGDLVLTWDPSTGRTRYSPVLTLLDHQPNTTTLYRHLHTSAGATLTLTPAHLVYIATDSYNRTQPDASRIVYARDVLLGDRIFVYASGEWGSAEVTGARWERLRGAYAPLTTEGTLVVDGVLASCYAVISKDWMAHWALTPLRWLGVDAGGGGVPTEGQHWYPQLLHTVARSILPSWWLYGHHSDAWTDME